jgi:hypothetical protein
MLLVGASGRFGMAIRASFAVPLFARPLSSRAQRTRCASIATPPAKKKNPGTSIWTLAYRNPRTAASPMFSRGGDRPELARFETAGRLSTSPLQIHGLSVTAIVRDWTEARQ